MDINYKKIRIKPRIKRLIKIIGRESEKLKINSYLVGGPVRDLLLGKSNIDLDIVMDKDVKIVVYKLAKILSARCIYHSQFRTAKLFLEDLEIDMATMREENYPSIGSLPQVRLTSSIEKDLFRRDFTINAMAIKIDKGGLSDLIDPYHGLKDLKSKKIRVLHEKSFLDDPTRIIRAIRFSTRFGFSLEKNTRKWLKEAVSKNVFSKVSSVRIGNEIIKLLKDEKPFEGIEKIKNLCGLEIIHPKIKFCKGWGKIFSQIPGWVEIFKKETKQNIQTWLIYFIFLTESLDREELEKLCISYEIEKNARLCILHSSELKNIEESKLYNKYSDLFNILKPIFPESIIYLIVKINEKVIKTRLLNFLVKFCQTKLYTDGERLKELGFIPGPIFDKILKELFLAKLDGIVSTKEEEENFIRNFRG